ncbi:LysR family transcriptional regulator [Streptacidiphilus sp. PAMC 29251]
MHELSLPAPVELRLLRALVVVAEEGGVSAAAARLHIAQPSLSRQLQVLERQLGLQLFERAGRRLRVTAAAEVVVDAARRALSAADEVGHVARQVAQGHAGRLTVAVLPGASPAILVNALSAFRRDHPHVETTITELRDEDQYRALREGRVDVALARVSAPPADLCHRVLFREQLCLVVSTSHRLANAQQATIEDLRNEVVAFYGRDVQPISYRWLSEYLANAGINAPIQEATLSIILATVAADLAVSVLVESFENLLHPVGVRFIPLTDMRLDLVMQWHEPQQSPAATTFRAQLLHAARFA